MSRHLTGGLLRPARILVAEDSAADQKLITAALRRAGFGADGVADGVEAFVAVQSFPYDMVLMDVHMPVMGGLAATKRIRCLPGRFDRLPILAMMAYTLRTERAAYLAAGMTDFVAKPIDVNVLLAKVRKHLPVGRSGERVLSSIASGRL